MAKIFYFPKKTQRTIIPLIAFIVSFIICAIGIIFVVLGPVIYVDKQDDIDDDIESQLVIDSIEDNKFDDWRDPGEQKDPLYQKIFYMYNLTNADDVLLGRAPIFKEVGPLFFQYVKEKVDVEFKDNGEFASYKLYSRYYYKSDLSKDPINNHTVHPDVLITTVNPDWMTALAIADGSEFSLRAIIVSKFNSRARVALQDNFVSYFISSSVIDTILDFRSSIGVSFENDWRSGVAPSNWTLPADYSVNISLALAQRLFDTNEQYSLVNPSTYHIWKEANEESRTETDDSFAQATNSMFLQSYWNISEEMREIISTWIIDWEHINNIESLEIQFGISLKQFYALQWGSLGITGGLPAAAAVTNIGLESSPCIEFACWASFVSNDTPPSLSSSLTYDLFEGTGNHDGFTDAEEVKQFFQLVDLAQFATITSRYGLTTIEAQFIDKYFKYILEETLEASVDDNDGFGDDLGSWAGLFVRRSAQEIIFGKKAPLLSLLDDQIPLTSQSVVLQRNLTSLEEAQEQLLERVNTGNVKIKDIGRFDVYKGQFSVDYWAEKEFFDGTDGTIFPRHIDKENQHIFSTALERNIEVKYKKKKRVEGVDTYEFRFKDDMFANFTANQDNLRYYTGVTGFHNFTTAPQYPSGITGVQLFYSQAHNLGVEDVENNKLRVRFDNGTVGIGLTQEPMDEYYSFYRAEPRTGKTLEFRERFQVNYNLLSNQLDFYHSNVQEMFFPIFWYDKGYTITEEDADKFDTEVEEEDNQAYTILWSFLLVGCFLLVIAFCIMCGTVGYAVYITRDKIINWFKVGKLRSGHFAMSEEEETFFREETEVSSE